MADGQAVRFAYADPPYVGQAKKHYGKEATYAGEVDHVQLLVQLADFDGWALSASSPSLRMVLPLCPPDTRIGAWIKPFASFKRGVKVAYAWEPVLFRGGRKIHIDDHTRRDWVSAMPPVFVGQGGTPGTLGATKGKKPDSFCFWLFDVLNIQEGDEFVDVFPGSGAVGRALDSWFRQRRFA